MAVTIKDVALARGGQRLLAGVSCVVEPGGALILRGPNGVGKTTLLRALAGLGDVAEGRIEIDAEDVAFAGHLPAVKAALSVAENLSFWAAFYGADAAQVEAAVERFSLAALQGQMAHHLSAGQTRRLGLARLMLTGSQIWLLDEPTAALDARHRAALVSLIDEHYAGGGICIASTHTDLPIAGAQTLDLKYFVPKLAAADDPFLQELA